LLYCQSREMKRFITFIEQARQANDQQGNEEMEVTLLHLTGRIAQKQGAKEGAAVAGVRLAAPLCPF
jgi:hypothetical protein